MMSIKEILEAKNKSVPASEQKNKKVIPIPKEFYTLKDKVDSYPDDYISILQGANSKQIDGYNPDKVSATLEGYKNEKIGTHRYLIQLWIYSTNGVVNRSYLVGFFNSAIKCYKRDLTVGSPKQKETENYKNAKEIFK